MLSRLILIASFFLLSCASKEQCEALRTFDHYMLLMQKWLSGMHEMAKWKWNHGLIESDLTQEERLLDHLSYLAATNGIDPNWAKLVIEAQVEAGNLVMADDFERWQREGAQSFEEWDLQSQLHPYLCILTSEMFFLLGKLYPHIEQGQSALFITQPPLSRRECDQIPYPAWQKALSVFTHRR
ncbi:MAG: hypothetical protein S4CHLAM81_11230 [Chlamydiales bacterium]|nr:hypothetical protein [Chlamydiales bacterium]MCH9635901.1 hypothetical protein [Chlamydiales bacterium]MCH9703882.1 hypothetical protein [Chlamydiota bacterium]